MKNERENGKVGYILAWAMGVPVSLLFLVFLLRGALSPSKQHAFWHRVNAVFCKQKERGQASLINECTSVG